MTRFIAPIAWFLLGAALVGYGTAHAIIKFPGTEVFRQFFTTLPELMAITLFGLGIVAAIGGIALMISGGKGVRERWTQIERAYGTPRHVPRHAVADYGDEDWNSYR